MWKDSLSMILSHRLKLASKLVTPSRDAFQRSTAPDQSFDFKCSVQRDEAVGLAFFL